MLAIALPFGGVMLFGAVMIYWPENTGWLGFVTHDRRSFKCSLAVFG